MWISNHVDKLVLVPQLYIKTYLFSVCEPSQFLVKTDLLKSGKGNQEGVMVI